MRANLVLCVLVAAAAAALWEKPLVKAEDGDPARPLVDESVRLALSGATMLPPDILRSILERRDGDPRLADAFREALADAGTNGEAGARAVLPLLRAAEVHFIHDVNASALNLLPKERRDHFRGFAWHPDDYPGGPAGPNEAEEQAMIEALNLVRPQRRANSGDDPVIRESEYNADVAAYIARTLEPVPGQREHKLIRQAWASFLLMRDAARKDGVELVIVDADRDPQVAARNAARTANPYATARFSSHMLGLAIDFRLSHGTFRTPEVTTRPMQTVADMRKSPVHKWLVLRGATYGWYPYQHEPWHWEYNPPGFRQKFWAPIGGAPVAPRSGP